MNRPLVLSAMAWLLLPAGGALAQNTIPNGMSGPGGTMTFSPAPAVPDLSAPGGLAPVSGSLRTGSPPGYKPPRHTRGTLRR